MIRFVAPIAPLVLMSAAALGSARLAHWLSDLGALAGSPHLTAAIPSVPFVGSALTGLACLFAMAGSSAIRRAGLSVAAGCIALAAFVAAREISLPAVARQAEPEWSRLAPARPATMLAAASALLVCCFALRVGIVGNRAFAPARAKPVAGKRAVYGEAGWMTMSEARQLFGEEGGIVIGERYRVDRDSVCDLPFRTDRTETWGAGGRSALLCFDGTFGSSHGIVFAGSGGYKTTSVTVPTALRWGGPLVVLDPSNEVAPMVRDHRSRAGRDVYVLDPRQPGTGINVLDWVGRHGGTKEEDIAAVASWIMSDSGKAISAREDFFRASGLQLITAMIADVCLSGHVKPEDQTLRQVRQNLAEPEPKLRERLSTIHANSQSDFVRENVAAFVNMTPETFSGVYANAVKETHWLSYPNYAALVSEPTLSTDDIALGTVDIFINIDFKALENHAGLARVLIGSLLNSIYNRNGMAGGRALFLLDEVARLGYMRILETARDTGRKYGITLTMLFQSIGEMRETYGGRDAASKWFESASWLSFAAINDPETADYISRRCGTVTIEIDQVSRSFQSKGTSRTRSRQLISRPLIQPQEVLRMRADEQVVFTAGNPPLRCGRAIWFRRQEMAACVAPSRFSRTQTAFTDGSK